jgi:inhibitor of cysteine peptidase
MKLHRLLSAGMTLWFTLAGIYPAFAETIDSSLIHKTQQQTAPNFAPKTFSSCADMRIQVVDFMETYYKKYPPYPYYRTKDGITPVDIMAESVTASPMVDSMKTSDTSHSQSSGIQEHSTTNTRTLGIDEPDTVKTDGTYIYSVQIQDKTLMIHSADDRLEPITKILLPDEFTSGEILLDGNRLILVAQKYVYKAEYENAWIDRSQKTVVVVYDITQRKKPLLERYSQIDGYLREVRLVGWKLTMITSTSFNVPYDRYFSKTTGNIWQLDMEKFSGDFSPKNVIPKRIDFAIWKKSADISQEINRARSLRRLQEIDASTCAQIQYVLPDTATLENYNFTPTFTAITQISVRTPTSKPVTNLLFWDVSKIYLASSGNLYLTSQLYSGYNQTCPLNGRCIMRWVPPATQTILHKYSTNVARAQYQRSTLIQGSLISDYAIDEGKNAEIRLVTQKTGEEKESIVTILNSSFVQIGILTGLGKTENFQSSRFIGDRLYLVTFKQIDPFFVIDMADSKNPKVLWELKIPGYSTYLHPYDQDRLIGIGYDTYENSWGGTQNAGIKVDLYNVSDVSHPKQEGTLTLGWAGSSSDALVNPRLFVWRKSKNTLYLPTTLTTPISKDRPYEYTDYFQGMIAIKIDPLASKVVQEIGRHTHISWNDGDLQKDLVKECSQYIPTSQKICRKLISWEEICSDWSTSASYTPNYCYADAGLWAYKAAKIWEKSLDFIDRIVYVKNRIFTFSRSQITSVSDDYFTSQSVRNLPVKSDIFIERVY